MSVVAWDGKTLAADRSGVADNIAIEVPKSEWISFEDRVAVAWTGGASEGRAVLGWYKHQLRSKAPIYDVWPNCQSDKDRWCRLIVATAGKCIVYETEPYPIPVLEEFMAWGSGRDLALGAMAMGASAREAVKIASRYDTGCGFGVDVYELSTPPTEKGEADGAVAGPPADDGNRQGS